MAVMRILLLLALIFGIINCQEPIVLERGFIPECDWIIGNNTFFPANLTAEEYAKLSLLQQAMRLLASTKGFYQCFHNMMSFWCHDVYRFTLPPPFPFPRANCYDTCRAWYACYEPVKQLFQELGLGEVDDLFPSCGSTFITLVPGAPSFTARVERAYPFENQTWNIPVPLPNGTLQLIPYQVPCIPYGSDDPALYSITCYDPWTNVDNPAEYGAYCELACPIQFYTKDEYHVVEIIMGVVGVIGYFLSLISIVTMWLLPHLRKYPGHLTIFVNICSNMVAFAFLFMFFYGTQDIWCHNSYTLSDSDDHACVFQGVTILFGGLAIACFWAAIAFNTFLAVVLKKDHLFTLKLMLITHGICWGIPIVSCIVALAAHKITYYPSGAFCFINRDDDGWWQYGLFYIPVGICITIVSTLLVAVLWEIRSVRDTKGRRSVYKNFRVVAFMFAFLYVFSFIFSYRFYFTANEDKFTDSFTEFARCGVVNPNCELKDGPNVGLFYCFAITVAMQAIIISVLFSSTKEMISFWGDRFKNIKEGKSFFSGLELSALTSYKSGTESST